MTLKWAQKLQYEGHSQFCVKEESISSVKEGTWKNTVRGDTVFFSLESFILEKRRTFWWKGLFGIDKKAYESKKSCWN